MTDPVQRRLAAIVSADVAGYSRLMGRNERGTLAALNAHRAELIDPAIASHGGRIVKTTGDGMLLEFPSVVAAVDCCVAVQSGMALRNADVPHDEAIEFRIGIHLGDLIADGDDIFGDGVNIAARLQETAQPGSVAVSAIVHDYLDDEMARTFVDLGERNLKNIRRPVRVWQKSAGAANSPSEPLALPDKPSIAVLPFDNMSADADQEFLADGIAEDIITALSKIPNLLVVARNSSFVYKGRSIDVKQVGSEQGVRFVLEGSIRRHGERIRVTVQLIDTVSGHHQWAERYDRKLDDIFALQDDITLRVVTELQVELLQGEMARFRTSGTHDVEAWGLQVQAAACTRTITRDSNRKARELAQRAVQIDAGYAAPLATLAFTHVIDARFGWGRSRDDEIALAEELALKALALDGDNLEAHYTLGLAALYKGNHNDAIARLETALAISPNHADLSLFLGIAHNWIGEATTARRLIEKAMRLNPFYPAMYLGPYGFALRQEGNYDEAEAAFREYSRRQTGGGLADLVIIYSETGRSADAQRAVESLLQHRPDFTIAQWAKTQLNRQSERFACDLAALRTTGLPE